MSLEDEISAIFRQCERDCGIRHITAEARIRALLVEGMAAPGDMVKRARKLVNEAGPLPSPWTVCGSLDAAAEAIAAFSAREAAAALTAAEDGARRAERELLASALHKFAPDLSLELTGRWNVAKGEAEAALKELLAALATEATPGEGGTDG